MTLFGWVRYLRLVGFSTPNIHRPAERQDLLHRTQHPRQQLEESKSGRHLSSDSGKDEELQRTWFRHSPIGQGLLNYFVDTCSIKKPETEGKKNTGIAPDNDARGHSAKRYLFQCRPERLRVHVER